MGTNQLESYFATHCHDDNANQLYQHTFEERMGMNQHKSYIKPIFIIIFPFSEVPVTVVRVVVSHQLPTQKFPHWSQTRELSKFLSFGF